MISNIRCLVKEESRAAKHKGLRLNGVIIATTVIPDDGDGDKGVDGDVYSDVEKEVPEFARSVANEPVVGGVVVCHERHADDDKDDVSHRQIQQQQVYGRPWQLNYHG